MSHKWLARLRTYVAALTLAVTASLMLAAGASAATFVVHNTAELEAAVTSANGNGVANTIELAAGTYLPGKTLILTNTGGTQTLAGPAGKTGEATPGAQINGGAVTEVAGVSEKELIIVRTGVTVTLKHVVVTSGGGGGNPGIEDGGILNVENATISGNLGSQIFVQSGASANLTNSTLSDGHEFGLVDEGTASLTNVTVVHNASGGIGSGTGTVSLTNTIVALNGGSAQCGSITITNDHSLASDASCGGEAQFQSKTPLLQSSLSNDGGSTTLYSEKAGSPTIDAGDPAKCPATDQRGYPRPDVASTACDIGADEYSPTPPNITVPAEIVTPATSGSGATVTYSFEATDTDALVKSLNCLPASGATFPVGTTKVECTAVDGHENKATASFNVTVTAPPAPVVTSVVPNEGPEAGGTVVTIKGEHLEGATEAKFGATAATELKVVSGSEMTVKDPAHVAGTIDVTVKTTAGTSTTGSTDHFTYQAQQATSPEAKLRDLLQEVRSSNIQHHIRSELSCLLSDALHSLGGLSGYEHPKCGTALLSSRAATAKADRRKSKQSGACEDLEQFVEVIRNDQHRTKPKIPAKLATAWSQAAYDIETSLGCMRHGRQSSRHPSQPPAHGQHRGHRSGGR